MAEPNDLVDPLKDRDRLQKEAERREQEKSREDTKKEDAKKIDAERLKEISSIRAASDSAEMFRARLEKAGYVLAAGSTGYCAVSEAGVFSLIRHSGLKKAPFEALMSAIPLDRLPSVTEVLDGARRKPESKTETYDDPKLATLMQALAERQREEGRKMSERHAFQLRQEEWKQDTEIARSLVAYRLAEEKRVESFKSGKEADREKLAQQLGEDRKFYETHIYKEKIAAMAALTEKQRQELALQDRGREAEKERYKREHLEARRIEAELVEQRRIEQLEKVKNLTDSFQSVTRRR